MVIWGAIWGAILGLLTSRHGEGAAMIAGALLGALAGLTLRKAVDRRVAGLLAKTQAARAIAAFPRGRTGRRFRRHADL